MTRAERVLSWTRPCLRSLAPYYKAPLEGDPMRLDQNTHLLGPNPVLQRFDVATADVTQYPTRDADDLREALGRHHALPAECFLAANGSDELLDILTKCFTRPGGSLATPLPSYSLYPFYATLQDLKLVQVPLTHRFGLDVDGICAAQAEMVVIASPNNPTGNRFRTDDLLKVVERTDGVVVVDEAYIEYAGTDHSLLPRVRDHDNLIVLRTFSKAYGLAGLRIGYLAGNEDLVARLALTKPPFNVSVISEAIATSALGEKEWLAATVATIQEERERLAQKLGALGFRVHPSDANFLLTDAPIEPGLLHAGLRKRGILARTFAGKPRLEACIRFTVGGPEHTDALVAALSEILEETA